MSVSVPTLRQLDVLQIPAVPDGPSPLSALLSAAIGLALVLAIGYLVWRLWQSVAAHVRYDDPDRK